MKRISRVTLLRWKKLKSSRDSGRIDDIDFMKQWVDHLTTTIRINRSDTEFVADMLAAANKYFIENLSDTQKADAFTYLVGKYIRK